MPLRRRAEDVRLALCKPRPLRRQSRAAPAGCRTPRTPTARPSPPGRLAPTEPPRPPACVDRAKVAPSRARAGTTRRVRVRACARLRPRTRAGTSPHRGGSGAHRPPAQAPGSRRRRPRALPRWSGGHAPTARPSLRGRRRARRRRATRPPTAPSPRGADRRSHGAVHRRGSGPRRWPPSRPKRLMTAALGARPRRRNGRTGDDRRASARTAASPGPPSA